jgi:hypothetical protein
MFSTVQCLFELKTDLRVTLHARFSSQIFAMKGFRAQGSGFRAIANICNDKRGIFAMKNARGCSTTTTATAAAAAAAAATFETELFYSDPYCSSPSPRRR